MVPKIESQHRLALRVEVKDKQKFLDVRLTRVAEAFIYKMGRTTSWASTEIFPGRGKVDILLIIFSFLTTSGVNDGGANRPPWQAKYKNRAPTYLIYRLVFFWFSVDCYFLCFSEYFLVILGFSIAFHTRIHIISQVFSEFLLLGQFSWVFPLAQTSGYPLLTIGVDRGARGACPS